LIHDARNDEHRIYIHIYSYIHIYTYIYIYNTEL
jgi:hypothetical protein